MDNFQDTPDPELDPKPVQTGGQFDDHAIGTGSPVPTPSGAPKELTTDDIMRNNDMYMRQQFDMYAMSNRAYGMAQADEAAQTGASALRDYTKRMEGFQKALETGQIEAGMEVGEQIRKDAKNHAMTDGMFYESFHSGAWADARSMTSDEHTMFLGTDMRARNQYIHDSSEASSLAKTLGLRNSDEFKQAIRERGIDPSQEGDWKDTIKNLTGALFNYENLMEDLGERKDPDWTTEARDNAWSAMNATENGREIIRMTELDRKALDRMPNQDSLIYVMNRKYKEMQFSQHASQDNLGGMYETFGQMLPSIVSDPDTVGELTLALIAAVPSGGASVATWASLKAGGIGAKMALRVADMAKHANKVARFTPTRAIGDFIVPFARAGKDAKEMHGLTKMSERLSYSWNNIEDYDNWTLFLAGAAGDGFVGGAGSFLINAGNIDAMNAQVYGKDQMPSVLTFDQLAVRGLMGVGGAWALGGAIRKTMSMAGEHVAVGVSKLYEKIHGMDKNEVNTLVHEGMYEKTLAAAGVEADPATVSTITANAAHKAETVGASPTDVAVRVKDKLKGKTDATPEDVATAVNEAVREASQTSNARNARLLRYKQEADRAKSTYAKQRADDDARADMNNLQTSVAVRSTEFDPSAKSDAVAAKLEADAEQVEADPDFDALLDARAKQAQAKNDSAKASDARRRSKKSEKQRRKEAAEEEQLRREELARAEKEEADMRREHELAEEEHKATKTSKAEADAKNKQISLTEATRRVQAASEAAEAAGKVEEVSPGKIAKKADREASQEVLRASDVVRELTQKLAAKYGVTPESIESRITEAVSWRRVKAQRTYVRGVIDAMETEGLDTVPEGVLRHLLNNVNPEYARTWDGADGDGLDLVAARNVVNEAARQQQLANFNELMNDPQALYIGTRLTREAYGPMKEQLDALDEAGPGAAATAAAKLKMIAGGGDLRDYDFKGDGIYIKDQAYVDATMENLKELESTLVEVFEVTGGQPAAFRPGEGDHPELNRTLMVKELHETHGFATNQEFTGIKLGELKDLLGYMRWLQDVQRRVDAGEISPDVLDGIGLGRGSQQAYLSSALVKVNAEIARLKENGMMPHAAEVDMFSLVPEYNTGRRTGIGSNMRDGLLGDSRLDKGTFDLIAVRNNLENRLARVDQDFDRARSAAAQAEIARLSGKVKDGSAGFADRVRLNVYNNGNKVANEIDFLTNEILPAYRTLAAEAAAKKRAELGDEAYEAYLAEQVRGIEEGIFYGFNGKSSGEVDAEGNPVINAETGNQKVVTGRPMNKARRQAFYKKYNIPADAQRSMGDNFNTFLKDAVVKAAREELGFDLAALTNGTEGFSSGLQVGRAAVEMLTGQRTLTGDAPRVENVKSDVKNKRQGETYAHVSFGAKREPNPTGNLSVRKQVDFIQRYLLNETERQILFDADGNPRDLTEEQSIEVIEYYASLRELSNVDLANLTPRIPFEQQARQMTLAPRDPMGSPLASWKTVEERVEAINDRLLRQPPTLVQGIHDDLTFAIRPGMATNTAGFIGDAVTNTGQGAGDLHGYGAGWQTLFAVPGSVADWLNIRSAMVFRQFKGMDEFSRIMGLKALDEVAAENAADIHAKGTEVNTEKQAELMKLKVPELKELAKKAGIPGRSKMKKTELAEALSREGMSTAEARKAGEVQSLIDLDVAVRMVQARIKNDTGVSFEENQNAWDASSQAVSLAKGLWGSVAERVGEDPQAVLDNVMSSLGWDKTDGLLNEETRMEMLRRDGRSVQEIGEKLEEDDLAELAADFYSKVWDYMVGLDAEGKNDGDPGRMEGIIKGRSGAEDTVVPATSMISNPARFDLIEKSGPVWNDLFDTIGKWGSKTDIASEKAAAKASDDADGLVQASMKKWLRDKLMKRPVMTRAYGAGGDAMTNAVGDFLAEAFRSDTPEAKNFVALVRKSDPEVADAIEAEIAAGRRDKGTMLYAMASNLGWAFADKGYGKKPQGQGERMGGALDMPDAKVFRDSIRRVAALHKDLFSADNDLRIPAVRYRAGEEKAEKGFAVDESPITMDDLYNQRTDQDAKTAANINEREATQEELIAAKKEAAEKTLKLNKDRREAVREKSIAVAIRRGWDENADPELLNTLGQWHLRNLLHIKGGVATEAQVRKQENLVMGELQKIIDEGGPEMNRKLEAYLENWLTKPDELILRSMNTVGLHPEAGRVETGLRGQNMTGSDLNPRLDYAMRTGTALHTTVTSSAGRQWNPAQGSKGDATNEIFHVNRGNSDEVDGALNDFGDHAMKGWDELTPEERRVKALQLAAQDLMLDFAGMIDPPTHIFGDDFVEPTPAGWLGAVAANEGNAPAVKAHRDEVRANWTRAKREDDGFDPDESADILQDDVRMQVGSYHGQTLFNETEPGVSSTDVGIPQMQINKLSRTADQVAMERLRAAAKGTVAGTGIRLSEMAVPATLTIARDLAGPRVVENAFTSPNVQMMDGFRMEQDPEWVARYTIREVTEYAQSLDLPLRTEEEFRQAFHAMTIERGYTYAIDRKLDSYNYLAEKEEEDFDWANSADRMTFMASVQNEANRLIETVYGKPQQAAAKESGHRNIQHLEDDKVAYPSDTPMDGLAKSFRQGGNRNNQDALLGPAPRANMILGDGDQYIDGSLLTGLMAKSVFHQDFAIGMGSAESHYRFGMWFLAQKYPGLSVEERAVNFENLFAKRLDDRDEYKKLFDRFQNGDLDLGSEAMPNNMSSLLGLGAVRERLATDGAAMSLAREVFGIDKPEDLTDEILLDMTKPVMTRDMNGNDLRLPDAYMDSLGRMVTSPHVKSGTILWRTMAQFRAALIDPKSQPIVRRMWFAAAMEREVEKIDLRGGFGARETEAPSFTMFNGARVGEERIDNARAATAKALGFKDGMEVPADSSTMLAKIIHLRGANVVDAYIGAGMKLPEITILRRQDDDGPQYLVQGDAMKDQVDWEGGAAGLMDQTIGQHEYYSQAAYLWEKTGGDWNKAQAFAEGLHRDQANSVEVDHEHVKEAFGNITKAKSVINEEIRADMENDVRVSLGATDKGSWRKAYKAEQVREIVEALPSARFVSESAKNDVVTDVAGEAKSDIIFNGDNTATESDPIFGPDPLLGPEPRPAEFGVDYKDDANQAIETAYQLADMDLYIDKPEQAQILATSTHLYYLSKKALAAGDEGTTRDILNAMNKLVRAGQKELGQVDQWAVNMALYKDGGDEIDVENAKKRVKSIYSGVDRRAKWLRQEIGLKFEGKPEPRFGRGVADPGFRKFHRYSSGSAKKTRVRIQQLDLRNLSVQEIKFTADELRKSIEYGTLKSGEFEDLTASIKKLDTHADQRRGIHVSDRDIDKLRGEIDEATRNLGHPTKGLSDAEYQSLIWRYVSDLEQYEIATKGGLIHLNVGELQKLDDELARISNLLSSDFQYTALGKQMAAFQNKVAEAAKTAPKAPAVEAPKGRALVNDMDPVVRAKRYPAIDALTNKLIENGVLSPEEGRKFAMMVIANEDILGELLPGMKFTYVGESGGPRMRTVLTNTGELETRIKLTSEMEGMDAMSAFDIIFHEVGHAVLHKAQAARTGQAVQADPNRTQQHISVLMSEFRNRALKSKEFQADIVKTMVAMHGEERGTAMATKLLQQMLHAEKSGDRTDYSGGFQEFFAQMMSWHLLSRIDTLQNVTPFMKELGAIYRAGYGEKIRMAAKMMDADPSTGRSKDSVRTALTRLAQIATTEAATTWKSKKGPRFDGVVYNSPMRGRESAYAEALAEAEATLKEHPDDLVAINKRKDALLHLEELGHGGFSVTDARGVYTRAFDQPEMQLFANSGLTKEARADLEAAIRAPHDPDSLPAFQAFGVINPNRLNPAERHLVTDHMLHDLVAGREDTFAKSVLRKNMAFVAEGTARQAHTQPWRSPIEELHLAGNLLNPSKSFENVHGQTRTKPISLQEISLFISQQFDRAQSAAVEITKAVQKRAKHDPEFSNRVNDAFEETFKSHNRSGGASKAMPKLEKEDPRVAEQVRIAATKFADAYDNAYNAAYRAGEIDDKVHTELLANRQLPVHLSEPFKQQNLTRSTAYIVSDKIAKEQLDRLETTDNSHYGYVSADMLQQTGILAPTHTAQGATPAGRENHVTRLDEDPKTKEVVDATIAWARAEGDEAFGAQLDGSTRVDAFFYASDLMASRIRGGRLTSESMPAAVVDGYKAVLRGETADDLAKAPNGQPYFMDLIARDFPDPTEAAAVKDMVYSGNQKPTYMDYIATKMLYRSRYGGYSFADSQYIGADDFRAALRESPSGPEDGDARLTDRGINRSPMAAIATFRPQAFAWHDKAMNQNFYGIQGFGYMQLIGAIESKLNRGVMYKAGPDGEKIEVKLTDVEIKEARKAIRVLREQAGAAMGRNPKFEADARDDIFETISPAAQTAVSLMTTPNWTSAALFSEGPAGVIKRVRDIMQGATNTFGGFSYFKNKGKLRDELHAYGLALPYHMTQLGFGHIWHLGDDAAAAAELDPTIAPSGMEKVNKTLGQVAGFGFERVNLAQRQAMIEPSQDIVRNILKTPADGGLSKVRKLLGYIQEAGGKVDRKSLAIAAKKAGVKRDVAVLLYQQGVFQSESRVTMLEDLSHEYNLKGQVLKVDDMFGSIQNRLDKISTARGRAYKRDGTGGSEQSRILEKELGEEQAMASALQSTVHHLITQTNMEPEAGARNVNNSPMGRMWGALTSYALMFSRNTLASGAALGGLGVANLLAPLLVGEMIWYSLQRMKNGESMQEIMAQVETDPAGFALAAFTRMPYFGAGSMIFSSVATQAMGLVGRATDGAVFGSLANERSHGMSMPGMPGVSMMMQMVSGMGDTMAKMADYTTSTADKAAEAAAFLAEIVPIDFRPLGLAIGNQIKSEIDGNAVKAPGDRRGSRDLSGTGFIPPRSPGGNRTPAFEQFADRYADDMVKSSMARSGPPTSPNAAGGMTTPPAREVGTGTPQAAPAELSAPKGTTTPGAFGAGSASSDLANRK